MEPDNLERIVTLLDAATRDRGGDEPAMLVRIVVNESTPDGFELGLKDIDGHPTNALVGLIAEDDWMAIGVISHGTAFSMIDPADESQRVRVRSTQLMARDGTQFGVTNFADGRVMDSAPPVGIIPDCMRRVFRLPTAPPSQSTAELFAVMWLNDVVGSKASSWNQAKKLHPATRLLAAADLVPAARTMAKVFDWRMVREFITTKGWWNDLIPAGDLLWMDDGLMSRWLFGEFLPLRLLVDRMKRDCPPAVARRVRQALDELGLDATRIAA